MQNSLKMSMLQRSMVVSLLVMFAANSVFMANAVADEVNQDTQSFASIYEPSGLTYLGDGAFILVEDEPQQPFHLLRINSEGRLDEVGEIRPRSEQIKLNDLEGVTFDEQFVYAITSHSLTKKGKEGSGRSVLVRYRYEQGELTPAGKIENLKNLITSQLHLAYPQWSREMLTQQLNIEALAWSAETQSLYIGLRAPVVGNASLLIRIDNPLDMFEQQSARGIEIQIIELDLEGMGIRAMDWDEQDHQFVIVAGDKKQLDVQFSAWTWRDNGDEKPKKLLTLEKGTEGLANFEFSGLSGRILLRDDGKRKKQKPAHYRIIHKNE